MIEVTITRERAAELVNDGAQPINWHGNAVFMFTGPGMRVAEIAYGVALPSDSYDLTDQSMWDIAILTPEPLKNGINP